MIGYRFLRLAEEEMTEASVFYEASTAGLGGDFLDEVGRLINILRGHPELGQTVGRGLKRALLNRFPFSIIYAIEVDAVLMLLWLISVGDRTTGETDSDEPRLCLRQSRQSRQRDLQQQNLLNPSIERFDLAILSQCVRVVAGSGAG